MNPLPQTETLSSIKKPLSNANFDMPQPELATCNAEQNALELSHVIPSKDKGTRALLQWMKSVDEEKEAFRLGGAYAGLAHALFEKEEQLWIGNVVYGMAKFRSNCIMLCVRGFAGVAAQAAWHRAQECIVKCEAYFLREEDTVQLVVQELVKTAALLRHSVNAFPKRWVTLRRHRIFEATFCEALACCNEALAQFLVSVFAHQLEAKAARVKWLGSYNKEFHRYFEATAFAVDRFEKAQKLLKQCNMELDGMSSVMSNLKHHRVYFRTRYLFENGFVRKAYQLLEFLPACGDLKADVQKAHSTMMMPKPYRLTSPMLQHELSKPGARYLFEEYVVLRDHLPVFKVGSVEETKTL